MGVYFQDGAGDYYILFLPEDRSSKTPCCDIVSVCGCPDQRLVGCKNITIPMKIDSVKMATVVNGMKGGPLNWFHIHFWLFTIHSVVIIHGLSFIEDGTQNSGGGLIRVFLEVNLLRSGFSHNAAALSGKRDS